MAKSRRLRPGDMRAFYLVVGECRELGADPVAWQTHLLRGLMQRLGAAVGLTIETDAGVVRPLSFVDAGWAAERDRLSFQRLMRDQIDRNPAMPVVRARTGSVRTFTRRNLLDNGRWYGDEFVTDYIRLTDLDDFVGLFCAVAADQVLNVGLNRSREDRRVGRRSRRLLHLCGVEIASLHGTRLAPGTAPSVSRLAPRLRQVLRCLFDGDGEKQAAARLGIAGATVHEYLRRLHRLFGVSSRGELLARRAPLFPALRGYPEGPAEGAEPG